MGDKRLRVLDWGELDSKEGLAAHNTSISVSVMAHTCAIPALPRGKRITQNPKLILAIE